MAGKGMWAIVLNPVNGGKKLSAAQLHAESEYLRKAEQARLEAMKRREAQKREHRVEHGDDDPLEAEIDDNDAEWFLRDNHSKEKLQKENLKRILIMASIAVIVLTAIILGIYFGLQLYTSSTTAAGLPGTPVWSTTTLSSQTVSLTFTAPDNGGASIATYEATVYNSGVNISSIVISPVATCTPGVHCTANPAVFTGLTNGATTYTFKIRAINSVGYGPFSSETSGIPTDYEAIAMGTLFTALNGTGWHTSTNWAHYSASAANYGATVHHCSGWHGVTCVNNLVTEIQLPENFVGGTIPTEIGYLTSLVNLNLYNNNIGGAIPSNIASLTQLVDLNLDLNCISGALPSEMSALVNLQTLMLGHDLADQDDSEHKAAFCGAGLTGIPSDLDSLFGNVNGAKGAHTICNLGGNAAIACPIPSNAQACNGNYPTGFGCV